MSRWRIDPLHLADVQYPEWHPRTGTGPVFAFLLRGAEATVLVDCGLGPRHPVIDKLYRPTRYDLDNVLGQHGIRTEDVQAIVLSHLHFDHCGWAARFQDVPLYVQRSEREAARATTYTVPEFVDFEGATYKLLDGDVELFPGLQAVSAPGHTPGHQAVAVETAGGVALIAGQAVETAGDWRRFLADDTSVVEDEMVDSLRRLAGLRPSTVYFSHDHTVWSRGEHPAQD